MARRPVVFVASLALVLAAVGAWWILREEPRGRAASEAPTAPPQAPSSAAAPPVVANVERAPEPVTVPPAVAAAEALAREIGLDLASGPADGPVLMAVEEGSGRPLAGVLMIVNEYRPNPSRTVRPLPPRPPHRLSFLRERGSADRQLTYVTADDGRVRVARLVANSRVVACHPSYCGWTWLQDEAPSEVRIELRPAKPLRLRVVDGAGRPRAQVPIEMTEATRERELIAAGIRSGDDGTVELHPFEVVPPTHGQNPALIRVALAVPLLERVSGSERLVDPRHPPDEPIELKLPPSGTLAVRVVDGGGSPLRDASGWFEAGTVEQGDARDPRRQIALTRRLRGRIPLTDGAGELTPVGLGLTFELGAYCVGHGGKSLVVAGPRTDGERVDVELPQPFESPTVSGRLVDAGGRPCANVRMLVEFTRIGTGSFDRERDPSSGGETDIEGRFRVSREPTRERSTLLRFTVYDAETSWGMRGERQVDASTGGSLDLGDVTVEALGVLAAGLVVDRRGVPVEAALVNVSARPPGPWRGRDGFFTVFGLGGVSGADGRFEIRGPVGNEELLLEASSSFHHAEGQVEAAPGARDVRIVVTRPRRIEVATRLDESVPPSAIRIQTRSDDHAPWRWEIPLLPDGTRSVEVGDVSSTDLRFVARGLERDLIELLVVPHVVLSDDASPPDPRLSPADLRGRLVVTRLRVVDGDGRPVAGARASLWSEPRDGSGDAAFDAAEIDAHSDLVSRNYRGSPPSFEATADGEVDLVASSAGLAVELSAPGFLPQHLSTTAGGRDVVLFRSASVRLEV